MQAITGVARQIVQIDEGRLAEVVVGEVQVSDLGGDDRLDRRRERRVTDGDGLVVVEVAQLLVGVKLVAAEVQGQDEIGLLDDLARVEQIVGIVQE